MAKKLNPARKERGETTAVSSTLTSMEQKTFNVEIAALGRPVSIGQLYNKYFDKFSNQSTLNQSLLDDNLIQRESGSKYFEMLQSDTLS